MIHFTQTVFTFQQGFIHRIIYSIINNPQTGEGLAHHEKELWPVFPTTFLGARRGEKTSHMYKERTGGATVASPPPPHKINYDNILCFQS